MKMIRNTQLATFALLCAAAAPVAFGQDGMDSTAQSSATTQSTTTARQNTIANDQKAKITGVVIERQPDTFVVRDLNGVDTTIRLTDRTRITERKGNPFRRAKDYGVTNILRGLNVEVEGRGDATGQLVAERVRFSNSELKVARTIEARVNPVENRVGTAEGRLSDVEQNSQRLSGQLDELAAVSNAARGGAKAAQDAADQAIAGVSTTNDRISALDDYVTQDTARINFRLGSAVLTQEGKTQLDELAQKVMTAKNYVVEVTGYADRSGNLDANRRLSQRRADAVVRYLAEQHRVPLRRMITPFGYGESQPIADDTTSAGRAQNRRVEVKILVNRGLTQPSPTMTTSESTTGTTN